MGISVLKQNKHAVHQSSLASSKLRLRIVNETMCAKAERLCNRRSQHVSLQDCLLERRMHLNYHWFSSLCVPLRQAFVSVVFKNNCKNVRTKSKRKYSFCFCCVSDQACRIANNQPEGLDVDKTIQSVHFLATWSQNSCAFKFFDGKCPFGPFS